MNDLPDPTQAPANTNTVTTSYSSGNKEVMSGSISSSEGLKDATGQEIELPKEVSSAGVRMQPTTVAIPPAVSSLGVKPAGTNVPVQTASSVVLPLSDDQIAQGLHNGVTDSVRWLSEWCIRRLKHLHMTLKNVHGKFVRVKI